MLSRLIFILVVALVVSGCNWDNDASQAEYGIGSLARHACSNAEFRSEQYAKFFKDEADELKGRVLKQLSSDKRDCQIFSEIVQGSEDLYQELSSGVIWPKKVYLFDMNQWRSDSGSRKPAFRVVGFFANEALCQEYRKKVQKQGYEAKPCYDRTLFWTLAWV
jgi:hypothetical protein